jgi:hypothetical protein
MSDQVLSLCEKSGNMIRPWAEAGYTCTCVDIQNENHREGNIIFVNADIREYYPILQEYKAVFAFPPCTDMAVSGARWMSEKGLGAISRSLDLVNRCRLICEAANAPYMIENPVSTLSTYWREPDYKFDPCEYAGYLDDPDEDAYAKKTCLWTGGGFRMPEQRWVFPIHGSKIHLMAGNNGGDERAVTPRGFAKAVFLEMSKTGCSE